MKTDERMIDNFDDRPLDFQKENESKEITENVDSQPEGIDAGLWQNLLDLGLTGSEARVYLVLVRHGTLTAVDSCKLSGVPRAKIYEILTNLSASGLCYEISGKRKKYSAVNPKEGLHRRMVKARRDLEAKEQLSNAAGEKLLPIFKSLETTSSLVASTIHFLSNADLTARIYLRLLQEAQQEILFLSKAPYNISGKAGQQYIWEVLDRGVRIKAIFEYSECRNQEALAVILQNQARGVEVRVLAALPSKLILGDHNLALLIMNETNNSKDEFEPPRGTAQDLFSGMLIEHPSTISLLRIAFDSLWQQALPLETFRKAEEISSK